MNFLILGSSGLIGHRLKWYLTEQGHNVRRYDIRDKPSFDLRKAYPDRVDWRELYELGEEADFVFFLAWDVGGSKYLLDKEQSYDFIDNNMRICVNTFRFLRYTGLPFLFTSSQMAPMMHSVYGNTKMIGERYTEALGGLNVRLWNVYGSEYIDERSHVISDFVAMAHDDGIIKMRTDGREVRQFLFVEDCCKALLTLAESYATIPRDKPLHVTSFEWTTIKDVAELVRSRFNCTTWLGANFDRVQRDICVEPDEYILKFWKPETSLEEGIDKIIKDYKERANMGLV